MAARDRWDQVDLDAALGALGGRDMSRERAGRIKVRALKALAARTQPRPATPARWRQLEPGAALAAGAAYLVVVFRMAAALYR